MAHYWIIERQNYHLETKYLASIRPTRWVWELEEAKRFNDIDVLDACRWLVNLGVSFTIRQFTNV